MLTRAWTEPEIQGRIYLQAVFLFPDALASDKDRFFEIIFGVMHKLTAVKFHLGEYKRIEQEMYEEHVRSFQDNPNQNVECFPLIFAFESCMFQAKSCLDLLVKLFGVVPLQKTPKMMTYTDDGNALLKALRESRDQLAKMVEQGDVKQSVRIPPIEQMIGLVEAARDQWLERAVALRDTISHFKAAKDFVFLPVPGPKTIDASRPTVNHQGQVIEPVPYLGGLYETLLLYCQAFMCHALQIRMPIFKLGPADPAMAEQVAAHLSPFIKWGLYANFKI